MSRKKKTVDGNSIVYTVAVKEYIRDKQLTGQDFTVSQLCYDLRAKTVDHTYVATLVRELLDGDTDYAKKSDIRVKVKFSSVFSGRIGRNTLLQGYRPTIISQVAAKRDPLALYSKAELLDEISRRMV